MVAVDTVEVVDHALDCVAVVVAVDDVVDCVAAVVVVVVDDVVAMEEVVVQCSSAGLPELTVDPPTQLPDWPAPVKVSKASAEELTAALSHSTADGKITK